MKQHIFQFSVAVVTMFSAVPVLAASIEWHPVQSTTSNAANDIVNGGEVVLAINGRSQSDSSTRKPPRFVTLDGIEFEAVAIERFLGRRARDIELALSSPKSTGDLNYDAFLTHVAYTNVSVSGLPGTDRNVVYPITGLNADTEYLVQLWYTDERPGFYPNAIPRFQTYGDNERIENTVIVPGQGDNGFGSFVIGNFTADSSSQHLRMAINGATGSHLTGILVREAFVCTPGTRAGDFDNDGIVQFLDFLILAQNFGLTAGPTEGDADCNDEVEFVDFLILSQNFGQRVGNIQPVPEPQGFALSCIAALSLMFVRKRKIL